MFQDSYINNSSSSDQWDDFWGNQTDKVKLNHSTVLTYSAVWRAVQLVSGYIASLPFSVYLEDSNSNHIVQYSHPLQNLLHRAPSNLYTSFTFRERLMQYLLLWGDGIALILRDNFYQVRGFKLYHPREVVVVEKGEELWYHFPDIKNVVPATNVIHIPAFGDGIRGLDPITVARESLRGGLIYQFTGNKWFENGHMNDRYVQYPGQMTPEKYKAYAESLNKAYQGMKNAGKIPILENGAEMKAIGMKPENMEFLNSKKFHISEVARWFGVPPHKLADLERSTNNNIEHQAIEMVTDTVQFWTIRIEQEFNRKVFTNEEMNKGYYVKLNLNGLLRGDIKTRSEYYKAATGGRPWMTPDEVRLLEDMNALGNDADKLIDPANIIGKQAN
jgi:HK97 family phage portal protein